MDVSQVFQDENVRTEFLDRFGELAEHAQSDGLEGLEDGLDVDTADEVAKGMVEGVYVPGENPGLEAIIERFTRPVYLVQQSSFTKPADSFPNSEEIHAQLAAAKAALEDRIPSVGRIELRNHRLDWVGTGWMVTPDIMITNRHVAAEFARSENGVFAFRENPGRPPVRASVDWRREYGRPEESRFRVEEVLWIEPDASVDVALLRVDRTGEDGEATPALVELMTRAELDDTGIGSWVAVIGYPAHDSRNNAADQQRIFDGVYNYKRLAPGQVTAVVDSDLLHHDATTLGGNSGSLIVDLTSGKAIGLHFGGIEGVRNEAVQAPRVHEVLQRVLT
jgi:S1-C subfamily serine protease